MVNTALEEAYKEGKLRAIGVSNFYPDHLIDLASNVEIPPMVNQVETHVFDQQTETQKYMKEYGCHIMAWTPLAEGRNNFFTNPVLEEIGRRYGKSVAQVALRWLVQRGVIIIPKSVHIERMEQNLDIFDFTLSDDDMEAIAKLDTGKSLHLRPSRSRSCQNVHGLALRVAFLPVTILYNSANRVTSNGTDTSSIRPCIRAMGNIC